jgi:type III pantothenate kinase
MPSRKSSFKPGRNLVLAVDIGNTAATCAVFSGDKMLKFSSVFVRGGDFKSFWKKEFSGFDGSIADVVVCSVNPPAEKLFLKWANNRFPSKPLVFGRDFKADMPVNYRKPRELGADRIVNALYAARRFKGPSVVVDFGTAVTFDVIGPSKCFQGGIIAPGINLTRRALAEWTALLPLIKVKAGGPLIGKSTHEAINSGLFHGIVAMVDGLLFKLIREFRTRPRIVSTGGDGEAVTKYSVFIEQWIPDLTLRGLLYAYQDYARRTAK